jgi:hypothetical protein
MPMQGKLVQKTRVGYEKGYIYFVNDKGSVCCIPENNSPGKKIKVRVLNKSGIVKEKGYVYYVDEIGDVRRSLLEKVKIAEIVKPKTTLKKKQR